MNKNVIIGMLITIFVPAIATWLETMFFHNPVTLIVYFLNLIFFCLWFTNEN